MCGEEFVTNVTLVVFNTSVCSNVSCQRALNCKCSETLVTLVRLLMRVDTDMSDKITWLLEFLGAIGTLVPSHPTYLKIHGELHCERKYTQYTRSHPYYNARLGPSHF